MSRLRLAILWHMHQPFYLDPVEGRFALPWTRLHSLKDYLDMPEAVSAVPGARANFNLVPSLIQQWRAWQEGVRDRVEELCDVPVASLSGEERSELADWLFRAHPETMIASFPGYRKLYRRHLDRGIKALDDGDLIRLKYWFHLAWLDPSFRGEPLPARFIQEPKAMTEEAWPEFKEYLDGFAERLLTGYPRLHEQGEIELSLTPFYHPILPLLVDSDSAREAMPDALLPDRFRSPEDARWQLAEARRYVRRELGVDIEGLWPSEGSVSDGALAIAAEEGFRWAASDEKVLAHSLGLPDLNLPAAHRSRLLYRAYRRRYDGGEMKLLFRDHFLSDRIGFTYASWRPEAAVEDFLAHLRRILESSADAEPLVPVILDGENCWEHYSDDGGPFLEMLYSALAAEPWIELDTIGRHLAETEAQDLERLHAGSWINGNFAIWIGHPEDNRSWDTLGRVRKDLVEHCGGEAPPVAMGEPESPEETAWRSLFAAEGSDWNWWYGDDHATQDDHAFDRLYRAHLQGVYLALGKEVPEYLLEPISQGGRRRGALTPLGISRIRMDGEESHYFEWSNAARWEPGGEGGAMARVDRLLSALWLGFGESSLHLRIDLEEDNPAREDLERVSLEILQPESMRYRFLLGDTEQHAAAEERDRESGLWRPRETSSSSVSGGILELCIPWSELPGRPGQQIRFTLTLLGKAGILEIVPSGQSLHFMLPDEDYDRIMWRV